LNIWLWFKHIFCCDRTWTNVRVGNVFRWSIWLYVLSNNVCTSRRCCFYLDKNPCKIDICSWFSRQYLSMWSRNKTLIRTYKATSFQMRKLSCTKNIPRKIYESPTWYCITSQKVNSFRKSVRNVHLSWK